MARVPRYLFGRARAARAEEIEADAAAPSGGGGSGASVARAIAPRNLGQPTDSIVLHDPVTIEAAVPSLVRVTAYLEIEENGGFWTLALTDNGVPVKDNNDDVAIATAVSVSGWGSWFIGASGVQFGNLLGVRAFDIVTPLSSNEVFLDAGSHELAVGIDGAMNAGVGGSPGAPDVNVRNVLFAVETLV
jgi:hypothetical protein